MRLGFSSNSFHVMNHSQDSVDLPTGMDLMRLGFDASLPPSGHGVSRLPEPPVSDGKRLCRLPVLPQQPAPAPQVSPRFSLTTSSLIEGESRLFLRVSPLPL